MSSEPLTLPNPPSGYGDFLLEIKTQIRQRQFQALRAANRELLELNWWLGENISRRQAELGWGKAVVENLARACKPSFLGVMAFRPVTSRICWIFTALTPKNQNCNRWLQKNSNRWLEKFSWAKNFVIFGWIWFPSSASKPLT